MIKETIENIRRKIKEKKAYREEMAKEYPVRYLFWGVYDKQVNEDELVYSYKHEDCFLINDLENPKGVIRLTGDSVQRDKIISITRPIKPTEDYNILIARDNNHTYKICIRYYNRLSMGSDVACLEEIISLANFVNRNSQNRARQEVVDKTQVDSEFSK